VRCSQQVGERLLGLPREPSPTRELPFKSSGTTPGRVRASVSLTTLEDSGKHGIFKREPVRAEHGRNHRAPADARCRQEAATGFRAPQMTNSSGGGWEQASPPRCSRLPGRHIVRARRPSDRRCCWRSRHVEIPDTTARHDGRPRSNRCGAWEAGDSARRGPCSHPPSSTSSSSGAHRNCSRLLVDIERRQAPVIATVFRPDGLTFEDACFPESSRVVRLTDAANSSRRCAATLERELASATVPGEPEQPLGHVLACISPSPPCCGA